MCRSEVVYCVHLIQVFMSYKKAKQKNEFENLLVVAQFSIFTSEN
jgi:hypothetical protein